MLYFFLRALNLSIILIFSSIAIIILPAVNEEHGYSSYFWFLVAVFLIPCALCWYFLSKLKRSRTTIVQNDFVSEEIPSRGLVSQPVQTISVKFGGQKKDWDVSYFPKAFIKKFTERATEIEALAVPLNIKPVLYEAFQIDFFSDHDFWDKYGVILNNEIGSAQDSSYISIMMRWDEYQYEKFRIEYEISVSVSVDIFFEDETLNKVHFGFNEDLTTNDIRKVKSILKKIDSKYREIDTFCSKNLKSKV